ncbi:MAG: ATP-binding protein [Clostridia bacterium]|nr:ATP-binding protein [Clostridia bacterium]
MNLKNLLTDTMNNASEYNKAEKGDYSGENGLLICGKCHTPKQCRIQTPYGEFTVMCICKCKEEAIAAEEAEYKKRRQQAALDRLRRACFAGTDGINCTFENDDMSNKRLTKICKRYVDNFSIFCRQGKGIIFYGNIGTGKTYAAYEIANALMEKGYPVLASSVSKLSKALFSANDKQKYLDGLNSTYKLLILDDLGTERKSEYMKEQLFDIINSRYEAKLPMIVTTNLTTEQLINPPDADTGRIYDRITERCFPVEVAGNSRRRKNIAKEYSEMKSILLG